MKHISIYAALLTCFLFSCHKKTIDPVPPIEIVLTDASMVVIAPGFEKILIEKKIIPDLVADGQVKYSDVKNIDTLKISVNGWAYTDFTSVKGIEYFINLRYLDMSTSNVDSVDLSKNLRLEYLNCSGYSGAGGTLATIRFLNVTGCKELKYLYCQINKLTILDVSKNEKLTELNCYFNKLNALDVSHNPLLTYLNLQANYEIAVLDLSKATNLEELNCSTNKLQSLDVSQQKNLRILDCSYNWDDVNKTAIKTLDFSKNKKLTSLNVSIANVTTLDLSANTDLEDLSVSSTQLLKDIDLSKLTKLKTFSCGYSSLINIDVSKNTILERLDISGSQLTSVDLNKNSNLKMLECWSQNFLTVLDLTNNKNLQYCYTNGSTNLKSICVSILPDPADPKWVISEWTKITVCN